MTERTLPGIAALAAILLAACASPPATGPEPAAAAGEIPGQHKAKWGAATEAEVAAALDRKFERAVRGWTKLTKDGVVMFCKRYRPMGSSISQIHCLTEAEVRAQVENMDQYREQMRTSGKCTRGPKGCLAD